MNSLDSIEHLFGSTSRRAPIRVEEFIDDKTLIVHLEIPGVDPDKDIELSLAGGILRIRAECQEQEECKDNDSYRSEFLYGSFTRNLALAEGVKEDEIKAS